MANKATNQLAAEQVRVAGVGYPALAFAAPCYEEAGVEEDGAAP